MRCFDIQYNSSDWHLLIDSSKTSLKVVLLNNGNKFASLPKGHSVHMKENYNDLAIILERIKYQDHQWMVCGDFKMLMMFWISRQAKLNTYASYEYGIVEPNNSTGLKVIRHSEKL